MQWAEKPQFTDAISETEAAGPLEAPPGDDGPVMPERFLKEMLAALAEMALRSKHRQADLGAALRHAGIDLPRPWQLAALAQIEARGWVDKVVPLRDGGVLLSLTHRGLEALSARLAAA